jgi:hypothetical protein
MTYSAPLCSDGDGEIVRKPRKSHANQPLGLSRQQRRTLDFIRSEISDEGVSPSFSRIARHLGLRSKGYVSKLLDILQDRGHITRQPFCAQSIALTAEPIRLIAGLPDDLKLEVARLALKAKIDPELVIVEAVRDGLASYRTAALARAAGAGVRP